MSSRKFPNINNRNYPLNRGKYSAKNIFSTYITVDELKKHPEIYPSLKPEKKLHLDVLSQQKPKIINMKGILSENKSKFASRLNSFYQVFFDYYKRQKNSSKDVNILSQENKYFLKKYKRVNKSNENKNKNKFNDIKEEYEKNDYYLASLDNKKNLFNGNILLSNKKELKNYILYDLGTQISNDKSMSFLHKINQKFGNKSSEKELKLLYDKLDKENIEKDKMEEDKKKEIINTKNEIMNINETINSMDGIDKFFILENKKYLNNLKNEQDRENSAKISTRYNSANLNSEKEKKIMHNIHLNPNPKKKPLLEIKQKEKSYNKKKVYNSNKMNQKKLGISISNSNENKINNIYLKQQTKTISNTNRLNLPLENLYEQISTKENLLIYQSDIKEYLENKKYDISVKLSPSIICNNFEKTREKICTSDFLKNDIQLRRQMGNSAAKLEEMNNNDLKVKNKMNHIEDKMIKLFCDINNPKPKE